VLPYLPHLLQNDLIGKNILLLSPLPVIIGVAGFAFGCSEGFNARTI
jgi:hypothetical protein